MSGKRTFKTTWVLFAGFLISNLSFADRFPCDVVRSFDNRAITQAAKLSKDQCQTPTDPKSALSIFDLKWSTSCQISGYTQKFTADCRTKFSSNLGASCQVASNFLGSCVGVDANKTNTSNTSKRYACDVVRPFDSRAVTQAAKLSQDKCQTPTDSKSALSIFDLKWSNNVCKINDYINKFTSDCKTKFTSNPGVACQVAGNFLGSCVSSNN